MKEVWATACLSAWKVAYALWIWSALGKFVAALLFCTRWARVTSSALGEMSFEEKRMNCVIQKPIPLHCALWNAFCASTLIKHEVFEITPLIEILAFLSWLARSRSLWNKDGVFGYTLEYRMVTVADHTPTACHSQTVVLWLLTESSFVLCLIKN